MKPKQKASWTWKAQPMIAVAGCTLSSRGQHSGFHLIRPCSATWVDGRLICCVRVRQCDCDIRCQINYNSIRWCWTRKFITDKPHTLRLTFEQVSVTVTQTARYTTSLVRQFRWSKWHVTGYQPTTNSWHGSALPIGGLVTESIGHQTTFFCVITLHCSSKSCHVSGYHLLVDRFDWLLSKRLEKAAFLHKSFWIH